MRLAALRRSFGTPAGLAGLVLLVLLVSTVVIAPSIVGDNAAAIDPLHASQSPSAGHWFGTDDLGRDVLARVLVATRLSLGLALLATALAAVTGVFLAAAAALLGGWARRTVVRIASVATAFPSLLVAVLVATLLGPSGLTAALGLALAAVPMFLRVTINLAAGIGTSDYVTAARAGGIRKHHILSRYLLRNIAEPLAAISLLSIASGVLGISALSFIGLGVRPPSFDWGGMLSGAIPALYVNPLWMLAPTIAIVLSGLCFSLLEEPVSRLLNPRRSGAGVGRMLERELTAGIPDGQPRPGNAVPDPDAVVTIEDLYVWKKQEHGQVPLVNGVSLTVRRGEILGLVGESGSGKSLTVSALARLLPPTLGRSCARLEFGGDDIKDLSDRQLRRVLGTKVALVSQSPASSLNPVLRIGSQLVHKIRAHQAVSRRDALQRVVAALKAVGIDRPELRVQQRPYQLSGGMRQRVMIAMGLVGDPVLLLADEPTTALDVTVQAQVLDLLLDVHKRFGTAIVLVSHDLALVSQICSRVVVMKDGAIVEQGLTSDVISAPVHPYTKALLAAVPSADWRTAQRPVVSFDHRRPAPDKSEHQVTVRVHELKVDFGRLRVVDDVDLVLAGGGSLGVVGESGSGKSTLARAVAGIIRPTEGTVEFDGVEVARLPRKGERSLQRLVQTVFQDPNTSLNPRMTVGAILREIVIDNEIPVDPQEDARRQLETVGLSASFAGRYPFELSGGQQQRVAIARALANRPSLLIADEPTSALDVTIQASILALLREIRGETGTSLLFISHNLDVVGELCDEVMVMYRGRVVEAGAIDDVFNRPADPYTCALLAAVPRLGVPRAGPAAETLSAASTGQTC